MLPPRGVAAGRKRRINFIAPTIVFGLLATIVMSTGRHFGYGLFAGSIFASVLMFVFIFVAGAFYFLPALIADYRERETLSPSWF
jgi:hypothetical protein